MNDKQGDGRLASFSRDEIEQLLAAAANRGARQALNDIGIDNGEAREDRDRA